jgi:hypothetical protein
MPLIVRIDVDRPYGKHPLARHLLSRLSTDFFFPAIEMFGYLAELDRMLRMLNDRAARAYIFFRRCTLPSERILKLIAQGGHQIGLHLEDSRSFDTFVREKTILERHIGRPVSAVSKHGSGHFKYGRHHHVPYEPKNYVNWARCAGMSVFFGNFEDPALLPTNGAGRLVAYPSAFWLEPSWRDTDRYPIEWLLREAAVRDIVLLVHPDNLLEDPELIKQFDRLVGQLGTTILS